MTLSDNRNQNQSESSATAVARVKNVAMLNPPGIHRIEFYSGFVKFVQIPNHFSVRYDNIAKILILKIPKSNQLVYLIQLE